MFTQRHRRLALAFISAVAAAVAACDNPAAPPRLELNATTAAVDSSTCTHGWQVVQGVVTCLPGPG